MFYRQIPKKSLSPQITPIIYGTFLTSNAQKVIFPQVAPTISSIYLTFLSDNLVCFYTQTSKKVTFPSSCAYNIGNLFKIFGWQSNVFLLIFDFFVWYTSFFLHTKIQKKSLFHQIRPIISGTFLTQNAQKMISSSNWP